MTIGATATCERYREVRELTLPTGRQLISVDATPNGGVSVEGWDLR